MTTQEIILQLLEEKGMTKAELAKKVGMAQPNLSRLLNGNSQIRKSTLEKIRIALDVDVEELKRFRLISLFQLQDFQPILQTPNSSLPISAHEVPPAQTP